MDTFEKNRFNTLRKNNLIRQHKSLMYIFTIVYGAFGVLFFIFQQKFFEFLEFLPTTYAAHPLPASSFLSVIMLGLCLNLALICISSAVNPRVWSFHWIHLITKVTTASIFLVLFFKDQPYWLYLVGGAIDAVISLILIVMMIRFAILRPFKDERPSFSRTSSSGTSGSTLGSGEPSFPQSPSGTQGADFRSRFSPSRSSFE